MAELSQMLGSIKPLIPAAKANLLASFREGVHGQRMTRINDADIAMHAATDEGATQSAIAAAATEAAAATAEVNYFSVTTLFEYNCMIK